jgi:Lar family restriction alleviation protein
MKSRLKPCPFCGATDDDDMIGFIVTPYAWAVLCLACQAQGPLTFPKSKAIAAWNLRAGEPK